MYISLLPSRGCPTQFKVPNLCIRVCGMTLFDKGNPDEPLHILTDVSHRLITAAQTDGQEV